MHAVYRFLIGYPIGERRQPGGEILLRAEAADVARLGDIRETVPDVAGATLPHDLRSDVRTRHRVREECGYFGDRPAFPTGDVENSAGRLRMIEREDEGLGDIVHMHEIAPLVSVFKDRRRLAIQQA